MWQESDRVGCVMGYTGRETMSLAEWKGTLEGLKEALESVQMGIQLSEDENVRVDLIALEAFDELDRYLSSVKRDLGI